MSGAGRPAALDRARPVPLDVREDIRQRREPFARIMAALRALAEDEALVLRAPFEPVPLYGVLARLGVAHWTERHAADDWTVWCYRAPGASGPAAAAASGRLPAVLDVRGLEPPQPMVAVLERLGALGPGEELLVVHDRRPLFLYPHLDEGGLVHETREAAPGLVHIRIRRPGPAGPAPEPRA